MRFTKLSLVSTVAALAAVGLALQATGLKVTAKEGDVRKYKLSGKMELGGMEAELSGTVNEKVTKVDDEGNITTYATQSLQVIINGSPMTVPDQSSTTVMRPDGTTKELRGETVGANEYRIATVNTVKLPDTPLEKDKTWTWDCPADPKTGVVHVKGEYKVLGDEKLHDIDTWKISTKVTELGGDTPASTEATVWLDKSNGRLVKVDGKGTNLPFSGAPAPVSGTMVLDLIP